MRFEISVALGVFFLGIFTRMFPFRRHDDELRSELASSRIKVEKPTRLHM